VFAEKRTIVDVGHGRDHPSPADAGQRLRGR
jgi:hypothetical protein